VDALAGLAAEFNLPARLQGNLRVVAGQRDDMPVLFFRLPAETFTQLPQNKLDTLWSEIGNRFARVLVDADLFILGPDAPLSRGFRCVEVTLSSSFFNDRHGCECFVGRRMDHPFFSDNCRD
jgi:hypothetical protein